MYLHLPRAGVNIRFPHTVQQPHDGVLLDFPAGPAAERGGHILAVAVNAAGVRVAGRDHRERHPRARPLPRPRLPPLAPLGLDLLPHLVRVHRLTLQSSPELAEPILC